MSLLNNYLRLCVLPVLSYLCPNLRLCVTLQSARTSTRTMDIGSHQNSNAKRESHSKPNVQQLQKRFCLTFMLFIKENFQFFIDVVFLSSPVIGFSCVQILLCKSLQCTFIFYFLNCTSCFSEGNNEAIQKNHSIEVSWPCCFYQVTLQPP